MKDFKYKITLAARIKPLVQEETDRYLSLASNNLKSFFPKNIDFSKKIDFLGFCGNLFVANRLNGNDDGIGVKEALQVAELIPYSLIDVEHKRTNIIGVLTNSSFSSFGDNKPLSEEDVKKSKSPFNVVVGGILWRAVNADLTDYIEENGEEGDEPVYLSWELGFDQYNLIEIGANKRNFEDGKIITDEKEINNLTKFLRSEKGNGILENGNKIGRIPVGDVIPIGAALTQSPAADVTPIQVLMSDKKLTIDDSDAKAKNDFNVNTIKTTNKDIPPKHPNYKFGVCPNCGGISDYDNFIQSWSKEGVTTCGKCNKSSLSDSWKLLEDNKIEDNSKKNDSSNNKILEKNKEILSNSENSSVKKDNNKLMKLNSIKDITDESLKECKASDVKEVLESEIKRISDSWATEKQSNEKAINETKKNLDDVSANYTKLQSQHDELKTQFDNLIKKNEDQARLQAFSARMTTLDDKFELGDKEREILASKVKSIDKDEDFNKFLEETEILLAAKKKSMKKGKKDEKEDVEETPEEEAKEEKMAKKESKASEEKKEEKAETKAETKEEAKNNSATAVENAVNNGEKKEAAVANSLSTTPTLAERYNLAFNKTNWSIKDKRKNRI